MKLKQILETQDFENMKKMIAEGTNVSEISLVEVLDTDDDINLDFIKLLIEEGVDVNFIDEDCDTSLMLAMHNQNIELIKLLIINGADINTMDENGHTSLMHMCVNGNKEIVKLLIENGADINSQDEEGVCPIFACIMPLHKTEQYTKLGDIEKNKQKILELLVDSGADLNLVYDKQYSILYFACLFGSIETITYLLEQGLDVNVRIGGDMSILAMILMMTQKLFKLVTFNNEDKIDMLFSHFDNLRMDIAKLLIRNGADINYGMEDMSLLKMCVIDKEIILKKAKGTISEKESIRVLIDSVNFGDIRILEFLIENGADLNLSDNDGVTPLMHACALNNVKAVKLLLENGADVNLEDKTGENAYGYRRKSKEIAKLLFKKGANIHSTFYQQALNMSKEESEGYIEKLALGKKSSEEKSKEMYLNLSKKVETPMVEILQSKDVNLLSELIDSGYDMSHIDLFDLIKDDFSVEFIQLVVENGAHVNIVHAELSMTPLIYATMRNKVEIVKLLVANGADVEWKNKKGEEAFDYSHGKDPEITKILLYPSEYITNMHRPRELVKILTNFTKDTPIKYTTHSWDFGDIKKEYGSFCDFMNAVKEQWQEIEHELKTLSPNLHTKIYNFLLNETGSESWCSRTDISIGWSSLDGLKEWCNSGKKPFNFQLPDPILLSRKKELTAFGEVVELFKQEIEIRRDFGNLKAIFKNIEKQLGKDYNLSVFKLDRQFYTDVEKFTTALDKIFEGIMHYRDFKDIEVVASQLEDGAIELKIIHIGSPSTLDASDLLNEAKDGDFIDIKSSLTNLCDWSVEGTFGDNNFRVNYLKSDNVKNIENLIEEPKGFTHILRFYTC